MNALFSLCLTLFLFMVSAVPAQASILGGERFEKTIYLSADVLTSTKSGDNSGRDYASAKGFFDGNLAEIPANVIIDNVYVVVDTAVVGITAFNLGDADSSNGFIASASGTLASAGLNYFNVDYKGSYLKGGIIVTTGLLGKYYSATGKYLALDVTGTASAGKARVIMSGYAIGAQ